MFSMKSFWIKCIKIFFLIFISATVFAGIFYKYILPAMVSNSQIIHLVEQQGGKMLNADIKILNPKLQTGESIAFTLEKLSILQNNKNILTLEEIDILVSLKEVLNRRIVVKKLLAKSIYADVDDLMTIVPEKKKKKEKKGSFFFVDMYNVLMGVKNCHVIYNAPTFDLDFDASHMIFDRTKERKYLHFDFDFVLERDGHKIQVFANDMNRFYMENHAAYIVNFPINIDKSSVLINAFMTNKGVYELNISAKNFKASDIHDIVKSNIFIPNLREMIAPVENVQGNVDFNLKLAKNTTNGTINIHDVTFEIQPLLNIPVRVKQGTVEIGNNDIEYKNFEGYYNENKKNTLKMDGHTKDYQKTCETKIKSDVFVTNDFFKNYLSKMLGSPVGLVGDADSKLIIESKNGSCDIRWYFLLKENEGFKFGDQLMVLKDYKTAFKVDLSILKNILKINTINYYITSELKRGMTPLVTIAGNIDMADNMKILDLDLNMPRPLPSEFLNFIACQKIFKKGMVSGKMYINNHNQVPRMTGEFVFDKVLVPAQRLFIRSAKLKAEGNRIALKSEGRFRRANYIFDGNVLNEIKLPIIVKDVNLNIDNIDVEKILEQPAPPQGEEQNKVEVLVTSVEGEENSDVMPPFEKGLIVIEKCGLDLVKGVYKEINFANLHADMTLDKNGVLDLKSNRFDIAEGISTLKVKADLVKQDYYLRLGVKDVDSNIMATAILGMPRQISGKAMGLIELTADKTLKLNGDIKFKVKNGTIAQVGYVEYILKVASLFRNPLAMISPSMVFDLVNIPEGKFDEINGEMKLKNNIVERMKIQSTAPELATLIFGRYDLGTNDASLRVYTKFTDKGKGFAGILRNISLNSLASKISISSRNDSNYYANELEMIPKLETNDDKAQVFLTKIDGDIINFNFISSLKRIK